MLWVISRSYKTEIKPWILNWKTKKPGMRIWPVKSRNSTPNSVRSRMNSSNSSIEQSSKNHRYSRKSCSWRTWKRTCKIKENVIRGSLKRHQKRIDAHWTHYLSLSWGRRARSLSWKWPCYSSMSGRLTECVSWRGKLRISGRCFPSENIY